MLWRAAFEWTRYDTIGNILPYHIVARVVSTDSLRREWKSGYHLAQFHQPIAAEIRIVGHLIQFENTQIIRES